MKGRFFWIALCLIGVSWTLNSIYAHSKQLAEPIFLDHYIETVLEENLYLTFYYLTNRNDTSSVSHVNTDGTLTGYVRNDFFDDFGFNPYPEIDPNMQTFTHYALREIQVELNSFDLENSLQDGHYTFNEIDVFFNDGKSITVPIGEVTILSDYPDDNVLDSLSSSGSNDGSSSYQFKAKKTLSIENITMKYGDALQDQFFVKLKSTNQPTWNSVNTPNWKEVPGLDIQDIDFPYELEKDENLSIYTQISPDFIGSINSFMKLTGTTTSGKQFTLYIPVYTQQPYLEQKDVDAIIKKKSEGGSL